MYRGISSPHPRGGGQFKAQLRKEDPNDTENMGLFLGIDTQHKFFFQMSTKGNAPKYIW